MKAKTLVFGMQEMFSEVLDEVSKIRMSVRSVKISNKKDERKSAKDANCAVKQDTLLTKEFEQWKERVNILANKLREEQDHAREMTEKAEECKVVDLMQEKFEQQLHSKQTWYQSVIEYIDNYYKNVVEKMKPR